MDNADAYRAIVGAIREARATIWLSQLALDADCVAYDVGTARGAMHAEPTTIVGELLAAARRGVEVRVLLNASLLLDTVKPLRAHLAARGAERRRVRVRGVSRFPQLLHAKMIVVDERDAILVGSPFANGYWDDAEHAPRDARRPARELGGRPIHDVSVQVSGRPAADLAGVFAEMWNGAEDVADDDRESLALANASLHVVRDEGSARGARGAVHVVRTAPGDGPMEIRASLLEGIARARSLIYVEHQYLSARVVVDALVKALDRHRALELVVVLNQNPDVTAYRGWQNERLLEAGLLDHPRVGVFALWSSALDDASGRRLLNQVKMFMSGCVISVRVSGRSTWGATFTRQAHDRRGDGCRSGARSPAATGMRSPVGDPRLICRGRSSCHTAPAPPPVRSSAT